MQFASAPAPPAPATRAKPDTASAAITTDRTYLPEIRRQLAETGQLIEQRKAQHLARYGEPMSENNVWLEQRLAEVRSMRLEIAALDAQPDDTGAVRGAGVCGRPGYQAGPLPVTISRKPPHS